MFGKVLADNIEEFYSINVRVAGIVIKLNKKYKLKVVHASAPRSSHDDLIVESLYEDVDTAMCKVKTQYTVVMGDFIAKLGRNQAGYHAVAEYGIDSRNSRGKL